MHGRKTLRRDGMTSGRVSGVTFDLPSSGRCRPSLRGADAFLAGNADARAHWRLSGVLA
jgi:hypothetical protein